MLTLILSLTASAPTEASDLSRGAKKWVRNTLDGMTLEEKAAQLVMIRVYGIYENPSSDNRRHIFRDVRDRKVGGVVVFDSDIESIPSLLNELQDAAEVPLLVAADLERGMGFRVRRGATPFPHAMAIGATRSEAAARFMGELTGA